MAQTCSEGNPLAQLKFGGYISTVCQDRWKSARPVADIAKTCEPLPDRSTGQQHVENSGYTGPPKVSQDLYFFNIAFAMEGLPTRIFLTGQMGRHEKGFHQSSVVFTGRTPVDYVMSEVDIPTGPSV